MNIANEIAKSLSDEYKGNLNITKSYEGRGGWHTDSLLGLNGPCVLALSKYYQYDFLATLKGPSTLFYRPSIETDLELAKEIPNYEGRNYGSYELAHYLAYKVGDAIIKKNNNVVYQH